MSKFRNKDIVLTWGDKLTVTTSGGQEQHIYVDNAGNLKLDGFIIPTSASDITIAHIHNATHPVVDDLQEILDNQGSTGWTGGGIISAGVNSFSVTSGTGFIRTSNTFNAPLKSFTFPATAGVPISAGQDYNIFVDYNNGDPRVITKTGNYITNENTEFHLGVVVNENGLISVGSNPDDINNGVMRTLTRFLYTEKIKRVSGLVISESGDGNRDINITAGMAYAKLNQVYIPSIATSAGDEIFTYYKDGSGGWNMVSGATQWPNTQYDDGSGTLADMTDGYYGCLFFYIDGEENLNMIYGQDEYLKSADAEQEQPLLSSEIPAKLQRMAYHIGRIIYQKSASAATEVNTVYDVTVYQNLQGSDHGNLVGLLDDDHPQYLNIEGTRGTQQISGAVGFYDNVTISGALIGNGPQSRLLIDDDCLITGSLNVSGGIGNVFGYIDFDPTAGTPPSAEGRVWWNFTDHTLNVHTNTETIIQVGQENVLQVINPMNSTISNGSPVWVVGVAEDESGILRPKVKPTIASSHNQAHRTVAVTTMDIPSSGVGFVTVWGMVRDFDTSAFNTGDIIWVSPTVSGGLTTTKPTPPDHAIRVGMIFSSHPTTGAMQSKIGVNIGESYDLHDITDNVPSATGQIMVWDNSAGYYKVPKNPTLNSMTVHDSIPSASVAWGEVTTFSVSSNIHIQGNQHQLSQAIKSTVNLNPSATTAALANYYAVDGQVLVPATNSEDLSEFTNLVAVRGIAEHKGTGDSRYMTGGSFTGTIAGSGDTYGATGASNSASFLGSGNVSDSIVACNNNATGYPKSPSATVNEILGSRNVAGLLTVGATMAASANLIQGAMCRYEVQGIDSGTAHAVKVQNLYLSQGSVGGGSAKDVYQLYIQEPTLGNNSNYSIYSVGGINYFGGNIATAGNLSVSGSANIVGDLNVIGTINVTGGIVNESHAPHGELYLDLFGLTIPMSAANTGSSTTGVLSAAYVIDGNYYQVEDSPGAPYVTMFQFTGLTGIPRKLEIIGRYQGSGAHNKVAEAYNWTNSTWETFTGATDDMTSQTTDSSYSFNFTDTGGTLSSPPSGYVSAGECRVRINHTSNGTAGQYMYFDSVSVVFESLSLTSSAQHYGLISPEVSAGHTESVTVSADGGGFVIQEAGHYLCHLTTSFQGSPNVVYAGELWKNGSELTRGNSSNKVAFFRRLGALGDVGSASFIGFAHCNVGDTLQVKFKANEPNAWLSFAAYNFTIHKI